MEMGVGVGCVSGGGASAGVSSAISLQARAPQRAPSHTPTCTLAHNLVHPSAPTPPYLYPRRYVAAHIHVHTTCAHTHAAPLPILLPTTLFTAHTTYPCPKHPPTP